MSTSQTTKEKAAQEALEKKIDEMKQLFNKIRKSGKLLIGFQRTLQTLENKNSDPKFIFLASDCQELSFKRIVLDSCEKHNVFVSSRWPKELLAKVLNIKEKEAQVILIMDFGDKWSETDDKLFQLHFVR